MISRTLIRGGSLAALTLALAACEDGMGPTALDAETAGLAAAATPGTSEAREVERTDIFSVTESGLWDGRPSLGGVWVAHPDVSEPESARIRNTDTGMTTRGALFRRERNNPGPRIQVSSDAAAALGMLAGAPAPLEVVVIRTETIEIAPPVGDPTLAAAADVEAEVGEATLPVAAPSSAPAASGELPLLTPAPWTPPRRPLFGAAAATTATTASAIEAAPVAEVDTQPLDTVAIAAAAIDEAEAEAQAAAAPAASAGGFVQIGLFSVEANADAAATSLRQSGIVPEVRPLTQGDTTLWRVLVGPVSGSEQTALLTQVKALGYGEAYVTPN